MPERHSQVLRGCVSDFYCNNTLVSVSKIRVNAACRKSVQQMNRANNYSLNQIRTLNNEAFTLTRGEYYTSCESLQLADHGHALLAKYHVCLE